MTGSLTAMARDLPPLLHDLTQLQSGIVSRSQILRAGLSRGIVTSRIRRGSWQVMHPGIYAAFSGEPSRHALLWAAVLYCGTGAVLSHHTAAELNGLTDAASPLLHVTVPGDRRVRNRPGIVLHLSVRAGQAAHPVRMPPQTRVEETVIDLWETAHTLDEAVGWVTRGLGRRLTTQDKLREAITARSRVRWRARLAELLTPDMAGLHSVLEHRYVRDVERPHGLPSGTRQAYARRDGKSEYRDVLYEAYLTAVELDGQTAHPGDTRWKDIRRDNAAVTVGIATLRYGWLDITGDPCRVAAEIAEVLQARGYAGARPCSAECPVGRSVGRSRPSAGAGRRPEPAPCRVRCPRRIAVDARPAPRYRSARLSGQ
jgi:hypothetical protein